MLLDMSLPPPTPPSPPRLLPPLPSLPLPLQQPRPPPLLRLLLLRLPRLQRLLLLPCLAVCHLLTFGSLRVLHSVAEHRTETSGTVFLVMHGSIDGAGLVLFARFHRHGLHLSIAHGCTCRSSSARQDMQAVSSCSLFALPAAPRSQLRVVALAAFLTSCTAQRTRRLRMRQPSCRGSSRYSTSTSSFPR